MEELYIGFYRSKGKMFFKIIIYTVFVLFAGFITVTAQSALSLVIFGTVTFILFVLLIVSVNSFIRDKPYIRFFESYLVLFPESQLEFKVNYRDIDNVSMAETNFQKLIKINLKNESSYMNELSGYQMIYYGQNKLLGFPLILINYKVLDKNVRDLFFTVIQDVKSLTEHQIDALPFDYLEANNEWEDREAEEKDSVEETFVKKNLLTEKSSLKFDLNYFKSTYLMSLLYFAIFGIFAFMIIRDVEYSILITLSLLTYPFAKVVADMVGLHKLKEQLVPKQGITLYFYRMYYSLEIVLFHFSVFLFPVGVLAFLIYLIKVKADKHYPEKEDK